MVMVLTHYATGKGSHAPAVAHHTTRHHPVSRRSGSPHVGHQLTPWLSFPAMRPSLTRRGRKLMVVVSWNKKPHCVERPQARSVWHRVPRPACEGLDKVTITKCKHNCSCTFSLTCVLRWLFKPCSDIFSFIWCIAFVMRVEARES